MIENIEDTARLLEYLRAQGLLSEAAEVRTLAGGVSNRVVLVTPHERSKKPFVVKQALEKLRVQVDWFCTPTRIEHEARALEHLTCLAPPGSIPTLLFQDWTSHLLVMTAVPEPQANWKQLLLDGQLDLNHVKQFAMLLSDIHSKSTKLCALFPDRAIFEALRLEPYYRYTASQMPDAAPFLNQLIDDTLTQRLTIVHGDYSPKNILIHENRLVLLDFEVVHFGDPAFDLGFSLAHFLGKANHLPNHREAFIDASVHYWRTYQGRVSASHDLEARAARHTLACCLARVAGRSPLEYLTPQQRRTQAATVLDLIRAEAQPSTIEQCVREFAERISCQPSKS